MIFISIFFISLVCIPLGLW